MVLLIVLWYCCVDSAMVLLCCYVTDNSVLVCTLGCSDLRILSLSVLPRPRAGFSGVIHQMIISKQATIEQLMNFKSVDPSAFKGLSALVSNP